MKLLRQLIPKHDPENGKWGDCYRTCIACLLGFDDPARVPHVYDQGRTVEAAHLMMDAWLSSRGWTLSHFAFQCSPEETLAAMGQANSEVVWLMSGQSSGCPTVNHVVICRGGEVIHSTNDSSVVGPDPSTGCTYVTVLVPLLR